MKIDADTAAKIGADFWQKWQETVADAAETAQKSVSSKNLAGVLNAQFGFGLRNAARWTQWTPVVEAEVVESGPADRGDRAADSAPVIDAAPVEVPVMREISDEPSAAESLDADAEQGAEVDEAAGPDNLTRIRGIGPAIEQKLHARGITTFRQLASLSDAELAELDAALNFRGRIERDEWVEQARQLADK